MYTKEDIHQIVLNQRNYFSKQETYDVSFRIKMLKKLKNAVIKYEDELSQAMAKDLGRSAHEAFLCDIGPTILEINETIKGLRKWARPETHFSGIIAFPSIFTKVYKMPYGVSLIISPFNFPILLTLGVLIPAIAGGNTAVIKTSSKSACCTEVMKKLIEETFDPNYITLIDGGHDIADLLLEERFDKIFYTGSPNVGKHVMGYASKNLTPLALELGGENGNWCIVRKDANIKDAARKIAFFKLLNSGQICININQVAVAKEIIKPFIEELKKAFISQIGEDPINNEEYPKLISSKAYEFCEDISLRYKDRILLGGQGNKGTLKFAPTIIYPVKEDEDIVNMELFAPILPIVEYEDDKIDELIKEIESREHGLALYIFTKDVKWAKYTLSHMQYGSGGINEVCVQIMVKGVPFGGVGHSGMGAYHGEWGFKEFTHPSTVIIGKRHLNLSLREHPYSSSKGKLMRKFLK